MSERDGKAKFPWGWLDVPEAFEIRTELRLIETSTKGFAVPLAGRAEAPGPRASIVVIRGNSPADDAAEALHLFLADLAQHARGFKRLDEGPFTFADGKEGVFATVTYEARLGLRAVQRHVYRKDGEVVTHLIASLEGGQLTRLDRELMPILSTYQPD